MITLLTALIIQGNDVAVSPYQDRSSNKWGYELSRMERGNFRPLVTCSPAYDSQVTAQQKGDELVAQVRALDLSEHRKGLGALLGEAEPVVSSIVEAVRSN